jgi:hypothetical protein
MRKFVVLLPRMLLLAAGITALGKALSPDTNGFLLFVGALAVEMAVLLLLVGGLTAVTHRVVRSRRTRERRDLAARRGWSCAPTAAGVDAELPAMLGATDYHVIAHLGEVVLDPQPVPRGVRAHAVVRGEVNGITFVVFDYFLSGVFPLSAATRTAWVIELPRPLPLVTSAEVFRDFRDPDTDLVWALLLVHATGREEPVATTDPDVARTVLTDDIAAFTRDHLPCWWVDGTVLASTAHVGYGAPPGLIASRAEKLTWLASALRTVDTGRPG